MFCYEVRLFNGEDNDVFEIGVVAGETFLEAVEKLESYFGADLSKITNLEMISDCSGIASMEKNEENDRILQSFSQKIASFVF